ncbi:rhodanese-like domain-containing protein [Sulfoacidibacillus ferrooxidans]|uniref:Sulfurtransferase n=1 Tax=Sulfoacidibacillus ferrooxidans TaxID=2005001 RepID=A0A9X1V526_9BACL|nr:Sulfurtransferase [Sulfoacidibacillus ferrooxidans]
MATRTTITFPELKSKLYAHDKVKVIDVREISEYREGHIEGSVLIPLDELPYRLHEIEPHDEIVVVCKSGNRSSQACTILQQRGFTNVRSLVGGLSS